MANLDIHACLLTIIRDRSKAWMLWHRGLADLCLLKALTFSLCSCPAAHCKAQRGQEIFNDTSRKHDWSCQGSVGAWVQPTQTAWQAGSLAYPNKKEFLKRQPDGSHVADRQGLKISSLAGKVGKLCLLSECLEGTSSSCRNMFSIQAYSLALEWQMYLTWSRVSHMVGIFLVARNVCFHVGSTGRV